MRRTVLFVSLASLIACSDAGTSSDAGPEAGKDTGAPQDSGSAQDSGSQDSGSQDSGSAQDSGAQDSGAQDSGAQDSGDASADGATDASADGGLKDSGVDAAADSGADSGVADSGVVDSGADGGNVVCAALTCPSGEKECGGKCVLSTDLRFGCNPNACGGACSAANAPASCQNNVCTPGQCRPGFKDCNNNPSDGCEADLTTSPNCGACGVTCGANQVCTANGCAASCPGQTVQCGTRCLDLNTSIMGCGSCNTQCLSSLGTGTCNAGSCSMVCDPGASLCGGACVDTQSDPLHCGGCGACPAAPEGASSACKQGVCTLACWPGFSSCNGACVNEYADPSNCGGCGVACGANQVCHQGSCQATGAVQVLTGLWAPSDLTVDNTNLYWTDTASNEVWQADKNSFARTKLASNQTSTSIATNGAWVFWGGITLRGVPVGGGNVSVLVAGPAGPIAADASWVYYNQGNTIYKVQANADAGAPINLASTFQGCSELRVDATTVWCMNPNGPNQSLQGFDKVSGQVVFTYANPHPFTSLWTDSKGACSSLQWFVNYWPVGACNMASFASEANMNAHPPVSASGDDCAVYTADGSTGIWKFTHHTTRPGAIALTKAGSKTGRLVVDASYVYWIDDKWIGRVHK